MVVEGNGELALISVSVVVVVSINSGVSSVGLDGMAPIRMSKKLGVVVLASSDSSATIIGGCVIRAIGEVCGSAIVASVITSSIVIVVSLLVLTLAEVGRGFSVVLMRSVESLIVTNGGFMTSMVEEVFFAALVGGGGAK